jgi:hypothetical protein
VWLSRSENGIDEGEGQLAQNYSDFPETVTGFTDVAARWALQRRECCRRCHARS